MEQENDERKPEDRVSDPDLGIGATRVQPGEQLHVADAQASGEEAQEGHESHLQWHDLKREHPDEHPVLATEVHPGEPVGRKARDGERDQRRRERNCDRVDERLSEVQLAVSGLQNLRIVVEGEPGVLEDGPPPGGVDQDSRTDRGDEEPEGGDRPEKGDDERRDRRPATGQAFLGALGDAALCREFTPPEGASGCCIDRYVDRRNGAHRISLCFWICRAL